MGVTINLMSKKRGELRKLLNSCFDTYMDDDDCFEWIYIYNKPKEALDTINVFADNIERFNVSLWIRIGENDIVQIDKNNKISIMDVVKKL